MKVLLLSLFTFASFAVQAEQVYLECSQQMYCDYTRSGHQHCGDVYTQSFVIDLNAGTIKSADGDLYNITETTDSSIDADKTRAGYTIHFDRISGEMYESYNDDVQVDGSCTRTTPRF